jgi:SAM-dependent methyltransferase
MPGAFHWVCPECREPLKPIAAGDLRCSAGGHDFTSHNGVLRLVTEERLAPYRQFLDEYREVRRAEGRAVEDADSYRALPFADLSGRHRAEWRVRAISFRSLLRRVVEPLEATTGSLSVADLGAGNGWLSRRLALEGHSVAAVDILTDDGDGLGARRFSEISFDAVQAEFDRLPLADGCLDLVVFNGSLHYSTDYLGTLREAIRVLRPTGVLAMLDTPFYRDPASGEKMLEERRRSFVQRHGFASDSIACRGFVGFDELARLGRDLGLSRRMHRPFYGVRWAVGPLWAAVRRRREPASFLVVWAAAGDGRRTDAVSREKP